MRPLIAKNSRSCYLGRWTAHFADRKGGIIKSLILRCLAMLGVVTADKIIGFFVYWSLFPVVLKICGILLGLSLLFALQIAGSLAFLKIYDSAGKDVLRISFATGIILKFCRWFKRKIAENGCSVPGGIARTIRFLFLSWQFLPPLVVLILRNDGGKKSPRVELSEVFASTAIATGWWTMYSLIILNIWKHLFD